MLSIWEMRKSGDTDEDNKKIIELMKKAFTTVNNVIHQIKSYVDSFNVKSYRKLSFSVKWTSLPK